MEVLIIFALGIACILVRVFGGAIFDWIDRRTDAPIMRQTVTSGIRRPRFALRRAGDGGERQLLSDWHRFHVDDRRKRRVFSGWYYFHEHDTPGYDGGDDGGFDGDGDGGGDSD